MNFFAKGRLFRIAFLILITGVFISSQNTHAAWNVSTASYSGISSSTAPATSPVGMFFRADGAKVYIANFSDSKIYQFSLGTAWDLTTLSYDSKSFNTSSQGTPDDVALSADGTKMFVLSFYDYTVRQYTLGTAWDVSTATYDSVSLALGSANHYDFHVKRDGSKIFSLNDFNNRVQQYTLSTPWSLSSQSAGTNYSYAALSDGQELVFSMGDDGLNMYIGSATNDRVHWYTLSSAWDTSTATYSGSYLSVNAQDTSMRKVTFNPDGSKMYMLGDTNNKIFQYNMADTTNPTATISWPTDGLSVATTTVNLVISFDEAVDAETGNISIYKSSDDSLVEAIDVTSGQVTGSGTSVITINPSVTLDEQTDYYVQVAATAFDDASSNGYAGISDETTWNFTTGDFTNPSVTTLSPLDGASSIAIDSNLVLTFSEAVDVETGNISIYKSSDDSLVESIDVTGGLVTGSGTTIITINPTADLANNTSYYIQVDATAFDDALGNSYAGITDETTWDFTTIALPVVVAVETSTRSSGSSASGQVRNLIEMGNTALAQEIMRRYPSEFTNQVTAPVVVPPTVPEVKKSCSLPKVTRTLRAGSEGEDVRLLQKFLNCVGFPVATSGRGSVGNETTFFSVKTYNALVKFQEHYASDILSPFNLTKGTGIFGELTRKKAETVAIALAQ